MNKVLKIGTILLPNKQNFQKIASLYLSRNAVFLTFIPKRTVFQKVPIFYLFFLKITNNIKCNVSFYYWRYFYCLNFGIYKNYDLLDLFFSDNHFRVKILNLQFQTIRLQVNESVIQPIMLFLCIHLVKDKVGQREFD